jgi:uncharacterized protein
MATMLEIKVTPQAGKQGFQLDKNGTIKCFLKSPPEDGKANAELVKMLAKILHITPSSVTIVQGATSRKKVIKIENSYSSDELYTALGLAKQQSII